MNIKDLFELMNVTLRRLNNIRRWTGYQTEGRYDEISKQALNWIICFVWATSVEGKGVVVKWERFPKIAIYRAIQKGFVNYDVPEYILKEICEMGGLDFEETFRKVTFEIIAEKLNPDAAEWISTGEATLEENIYKASTKIATLLELNEVQKHVNGEYWDNHQEIIKSLAKYSEIPFYEELTNTKGNYFKLFKEISKLRNQNRWAAYSYNVECSVLGHLFDTAIFAYLMALEKGAKEREATKHFFIGLFHDVPEVFTRDIPSPIKDKIPGFRELTEQYEMLMMEQNVYPYVSDEVEKALKGIMMENDENANFKSLIKGADYLSAIAEIHRQYMDPEFSRAAERQMQQFEDNSGKRIEITKSAMDMCHRLMKQIEGEGV